MNALIRKVAILGATFLVAPAASAQDTAVLETAGVTVEIDTEAWRGEPERFDKVLPVLVRITNDGEVPLRIRHTDFALLTGAGDRVAATPPFELEGTETVRSDRRYDPFDIRYRYPYRFFRFGPYGRIGYIGYPYSLFDDYRPYDSVKLPTTDMVSGALPETVVEPGDRVTGFIYFVDDDDVVDLDHAGRVTFQVALVNAETREPIDTIAIALLATSDKLEIANGS